MAIPIKSKAKLLHTPQLAYKKELGSVKLIRIIEIICEVTITGKVEY